MDRKVICSAEEAAKGAYPLLGVANADVILIATGSEVSLALSAAEQLTQSGINTEVISAISLEWFARQPQSYREKVLPAKIKARVSIEAGVGMGWREYVGEKGEIISIDHFGASASHTKLFSEFGFTVENIVAAAKRTLEKSQKQ